MMRWDQTHKAAAWAAGAVVLGMIGAVLSDGHVTPGEVWTLIAAAGTTFFAYLKDHPTQDDYVTPPGPGTKG